MTELEIKILNKFLELKTSMKQAVEKIQHTVTTQKIELPFLVDGVMDSVVYNTDSKDFEEIRYYVGTGPAFLTPLSNSAGFYDKTEQKIIYLADVDWKNIPID